MVSRPTRGTSLRLITSSVSSRTVQRARPAGGGEQTTAIICWLLALVQGRSFARTCGVEQRSLQPFLLVPLADLPDGFGGKTKVPAHHRRGLSLIHLP
jgi:hypothetical protein